MKMEMKPIAWMKSVFLYKNGTPRQSSVCPLARGTITIEKTIFNNPHHAVEDLQEYSHIWIIFVFHENNNDHFKAKVRPPRLGGKRLGVFSTRSPYRPNPIGLTLAKLDKVIGSTLHVSGIDILNGTPILDIKPYIPDYDQPKIDTAVSLDQEVDEDMLVNRDETKFSNTYDSRNDFSTLPNIIKGNACCDALSDDCKIIDEFVGIMNTPTKDNSNHRNNISEKNCVKNCDISKGTSANLEFPHSRTVVGHAPVISELSVCSFTEDTDTKESNLLKTESSGTNPNDEVLEARPSDPSLNEKVKRTFAPIMSEMELRSLENTHKTLSPSKSYHNNTTNLDDQNDTESKTLNPMCDCESMNKNSVELSHAGEKSVPVVMSMGGEITPDSNSDSSHCIPDENIITASDECARKYTNTESVKNNEFVQNQYVKESILKHDECALETTANSGNVHQHGFSKFLQFSSVLNSDKDISVSEKDGELQHLSPCMEHVKNTDADIPDNNEVKTATWLKTSENLTLSVRFTSNSLEQLHKFSQLSKDRDFLMNFLKNSSELREAIEDILKGDPRSIYRKNSCKDSLYYFTVDTAHVTCWFDDDNYIAEVLRVQPLSKAKF